MATKTRNNGEKKLAHDPSIVHWDFVKNGVQIYGKWMTNSDLFRTNYLDNEIHT